MVPTIFRELDVSLETAQCLLTVTLLVGAIACLVAVDAAVILTPRRPA